MNFLKIINLAFLMVSCIMFAEARGVKHYSIEVLAEYPHDRDAYTQGLFFQDGQLYESTGQYGKSTFRKVDYVTGKVLRRLDFGRKYFVEGSVVLDGRLYILTWQNKVAFVYDFPSLEYEATYSYPREGWGLTSDGKNLIASDGSSSIYFLDGKFRTQRKLNVTMNGRPLRFINELEYVDGRIWANVYTTDLIVIINPESGEVEATVDCTGLLPKKYMDADTDVLNGIACNPADGKLLLTGKNWPFIYEIRLVEKK